MISDSKLSNFINYLSKLCNDSKFSQWFGHTYYGAHYGGSGGSGDSIYYDDVKNYDFIKSQISKTFSGHSAIGIALHICKYDRINNINILLNLGCQPTAKDLQIARMNFYYSLSENEKNHLIYIIKIINHDFCKIIIKFLINHLMIEHVPYLPSLLY